MLSAKVIANFIKNRVSDLDEGWKVAKEGLGNGQTISTGRIAAALAGMGQTINALRDITPLLEQMASEQQADPIPQGGTQELTEIEKILCKEN